MTVVHFVTGNSFGGVEGHICTLIKLMKNSDIVFKVICHKAVRNDFMKRLEHLDVEVIGVNFSTKLFLKNYLELVKTFRKMSPDIVHCHLYSASRVGAMAAKIAGAKNVIETIHLEEVWRRGLKKILFNSFDAFVGRLFVDHYIAVSEAVSDYYQKNKWVPSNKITLIHNTTEHEPSGVYTNDFSFRIGFLGRLVEQKGVDTLIKSIAILHDDEYSPHLFIGGTGPLESKLKQQVIELNVESRVTFLGNVSDKDQFFNNIDIFVLPSRYEGFPLVLLEAGMYQMPVVATDVSGNPEIIRHGETGILVKSDNPQELASGISAYLDSNKRDEYSKQLKSLIESEFSKEIYTDKMQVFYKSMVK